MPAYCVENDLLLGNIPTPDAMSKTQFVQDAADEIDSRIGMRYETPIDLTDPELKRPVKLLLKRLNVFLATGRFILAVTSNNEDDRLHAYGLSLINDAIETLEAIATGKFLLEGATPTAGESTPASTPLIFNEDPESSVEAFYNRIANPRYVYPFQIAEPYLRDVNSENGIIR